MTASGDEIYLFTAGPSAAEAFSAEQPIGRTHISSRAQMTSVDIDCVVLRGVMVKCVCVSRYRLQLQLHVVRAK